MTESDQYSSILSIGRRQSDSDIFQNGKLYLILSMISIYIILNFRES